ncbi:unnamed protein product, partial [Iphiclides podalirius]
MADGLNTDTDPIDRSRDVGGASLGARYENICGAIISHPRPFVCPNARERCFDNGKQPRTSRPPRPRYFRNVARERISRSAADSANTDRRLDKGGCSREMWRAFAQSYRLINTVSSTVPEDVKQSLPSKYVNEQKCELVEQKCRGECHTQPRRWPIKKMLASDVLRQKYQSASACGASRAQWSRADVIISFHEQTPSVRSQIMADGRRPPESWRRPEIYRLLRRAVVPAQASAPQVWRLAKSYDNEAIAARPLSRTMAALIVPFVRPNRESRVRRVRRFIAAEF